jgi:glycosyltransferase involved in cell wall biosynthesis
MGILFRRMYMKIFVLSDFAAPYRKEVFKGLSQKYDIDVFFNIAKSDQRDPKWYAHSDGELEFYVLNTEEAQAKYDNCIKNIKSYDLVICYDPWHKRSRALQRLCIRKKIPYVLNADGALGINTSFPKKQIKTFYTKRAALCFAGCERAVEYFKTYGAKAEKIVKHPFTSLKKDQLVKEPLTTEEKAEKKKSLGIDEKTMFITVGQFIHRKAFDLLLSAWEKAEQTSQLYIIGGGPLEEQYLQTIAEKKLANVHIVGFKKPDELKEYYLASDVFVMPTRKDIWGLVVNEAMAAALPIISSDRCTSGNELVANDVNGYIYPCEDTELLAKYIDKLGNDDKLRQAFSNSSLSKISEYVIENIVDSHIASIDKLMNI